MRRILIFLNLAGWLLGAGQIYAGAALDFPVEVTQVRDLGLSDRDESKSVIEVSWRAGAIREEKIAAFNLVLSVTYADGTIITEKRKFEKSVFSARIEVPSVKILGGRPTAFIKKAEARVSAAVSGS